MSTSITNITSLSTLKDEETKYTELSVKEDDDLLKIFFDGNTSIDTRILSLEILEKRNSELCSGAVNKVASMFAFSPNHIFRELLKSIVITSSLDINIKTECARSLYDENKEVGYECFKEITVIMDTLPIPLQVDITRTMMETMKYYDVTFSRLQKIITNKRLECEYRYKTVQCIQKDTTRKFKVPYLNEAYLVFFKSVETYIRYKILAAQYLFQLSKADNKNQEFKSNILEDVVLEVEKTCIEFATDSTLDYNLRADVADLLVRMGGSKAKEIGKEIILFLGRNPDGISTIYNNRQNVHDDTIDESVRKFVLYIASLRSELKSDGHHIVFSDVQREIEDIAKTYPTSDNSKSVMDCVRSSLLRISLDQTIYPAGQTLQSIFNKVWRLILSHTHCEILKTRMVEELIDMADTCSSGHISRIVNVLCGFEIDGKTFSIEIGWKKQIQSNLIARLTKKIKDIEDEETRDTILEEMMTGGDMINKKELSAFFRNNLLSIRDDLYIEFVTGKYITEDDFEEYIRSSIVFFETGSE